MDPHAHAVVTRADTQPVEGFPHAARGTVTWRTLFSRDRTPTRDLTAGITDVPPGGRLALHRHAATEIYYILSGRGVVTIDGRDWPVAADDAVFIPGQAEHGIRADESALRFLYVFPTDSFADVVYTFSNEAPPA